MYRHEYDGAEGWKYVPILDKDALSNPQKYDEINPLFKDVKFVIKNDYEILTDDYDNEYISRWDYEKLLDYRGYTI